MEKRVQEHPEDAAAQVAWLKLLLEDRQAARADEVARRLTSLKPGAAILTDAGRALIAQGRYSTAIELLRQAGTEVDLAVAILQGGKPALALSELDKIPDANRDSDYHMTRAEVLNALGKAQESDSAVDQALASARGRPDVYRRAAALLIANGRIDRAVSVLDRAPRERSILLMRASLTGATAAFLDIQNRWPEWYPGWAAQGIILAEHQHFAEARKVIETAVALGAREPEVYYYLAWCQKQEGIPAQSAIDRAAALSGETPDPWIQSLAKGNFEKPPYLDRLIQGLLFK